LAEKEELTDDEAKAKFEALLKVLEANKKTSKTPVTAGPVLRRPAVGAWVWAECRRPRPTRSKPATEPLNSNHFSRDWRNERSTAAQRGAQKSRRMADRVGFAKIGLDSRRTKRIGSGILFNSRRDVSGGNRPKRFVLLCLRFRDGLKTAILCNGPVLA